MRGNSGLRGGDTSTLLGGLRTLLLERERTDDIFGRELTVGHGLPGFAGQRELNLLLDAKAAAVGGARRRRGPRSRLGRHSQTGVVHHGRVSRR
ncbi:hypothetical protein EYF80_014298 [Liparis tanakae]|uniref:Uncharacterized protein n=1 Tax=Liparis tanakae TaxID=230148 RepID=A0A4Z2IBW7_9TELE|nr:hypothetical protein EYF80_014298 [Liparis tanakae]